MKRFKKVALIALMGIFLIALPVAVLAFNRDKDVEQSIYVGPDEIIEGNFIKVGNFIDINGAVNGDVIVAGNSITISGPVSGDVIAVGNTIKIRGTVGGSIRVAGSTIDIDSVVERNVVAIGNSISIGTDAKVGWDVYAGGATVEIKGPVGGNIWAGAANIVIGNTVGKDVTVSVDQGGHITLYPEAKVEGNLTYKAVSEEQLVLKEGAEIVGEVSKKDLPIPQDFDFKELFSGVNLFFKTIMIFSLLLIGLVLIALVPKILLQIKEEMVKRPGVSIGWGLIYVIITPIVALLLMVTIIGIPLAFIILPLYVIGFFLAKVSVSFVLGLLLLDNLAKDKKYKGSLIWPLVIGLIIFTIITSLPIIGWFVKLLLVLWALGAAVTVKKELLKEYR